jgi:hypothetical protein
VQAHFVPELRSTYAQAQFGFSMLLFMIAQRDFDTAVPDALAANARLRALLEEARDALGRVDAAGAADAQTRLATLPPAAETLKLSDLRREHDALRAAIGGLAPLIEPAADVEPLAPLREVRARLFDELAADARSRTVPILSG